MFLNILYVLLEYFNALCFVFAAMGLPHFVCREVDKWAADNGRLEGVIVIAVARRSLDVISGN